MKLLLLAGEFDNDVTEFENSCSCNLREYKVGQLRYIEELDKWNDKVNIG